MMIDPFTAQDIQAMERVESLKSSAFEDLVRAAGLDPLVDLRFCSLRGADLRGSDLREFDLTGCDVEGALISDSTQLPNEMRLQGVRGNWIKVADRRSIVDLMRAIETPDANLRATLLRSLIQDYDSDHHIDRFLLNWVKKVKSAEHALEFFACMSPDFVLENQRVVRAELKRILLNDERRSNTKRKVGGKDKYSFVSKLVEWIEQSDMDDVADAASDFKSGSLSLGRLIDLI
jgi:hypothetical protein